MDTLAVTSAHQNPIFNAPSMHLCLPRVSLHMRNFFDITSRRSSCAAPLSYLNPLPTRITQQTVFHHLFHAGHLALSARSSASTSLRSISLRPLEMSISLIFLNEVFFQNLKTRKNAIYFLSAGGSSEWCKPLTIIGALRYASNQFFVLSPVLILAYPTGAKPVQNCATRIRILNASPT